MSGKEDEIINRHMDAMLKELNRTGIRADAALGFIVIEPRDYHVTVHHAERVVDRVKKMGGETFIKTVIGYVRDTLTDVLEGKAVMRDDDRSKH